MRIADKMTFDQITSNLHKNRSQMSDLQNQAASQKRVTKPSDDPVAAARVLGSRLDLQGNEQYTKNLNYARSFLEFTDQTLSELTELLVRAKELTLSQADDAGANETTRKVTAAEVSQIFDQMVQISNRKLGERFIFGGFKTKSSPFNLRGSYAGDSGEMLVHVNKGSFLAMNLPGDKVFLGEGVSGDGITHSTSVQAQTVEELAQQMHQVQQKNTQRQQLNSSAQAPSAHSKNNQLQQGQQQRGPASAANAHRAPLPQEDKALEGQRGINIFNAVKGLAISLKTNDKVGIQDSIEVLDNSISQVVLARSQVGSRVSVLGNAMSSLAQEKVDTQGTISNLEDADAFQVISDITKAEGALKAAMETSGRMVQKSLMDFI